MSRSAPAANSCAARTATAPASTITTSAKSASWLETNISRAATATASTQLPDRERAGERELAPQRAEPHGAVRTTACTSASASVPSASSSAKVSSPSWRS